MNKNAFLIIFLISILSYTKCASGEINCEYEISSSGEYIKILGDNFIPDPSISMTVNEEKVSFSTKYLFPKPGIFHIKFN